MNKQKKAKRTGSKRAAANPRKKPSGPWNLRITPALRLSAQEFHAALLRIHTCEGGESPPPTIGSLDVRLKFQILLNGSRAAELVQMIGAASDGNLAADAERFNRLVLRFESLREQADTHENSASTTSSKRICDKLLARIYQAQLQLDDLGEPPYRSSGKDGADELPDFMSIWRERERYTTQLAQLEKVSSELGIHVNELGPKPPGVVRAPRGLAPLPIESSSNEVTVSVDDLLGGPLAGWVSKIGRSVSHTEILNMKPRWRDLGVAYCELHLKSGLMDFEVLGIEDGEENPFWDEARDLLSQAQRHLLDFLKAACEFDNPPALAEPVSKADATEAKEPPANPPIQRHVVVLVKAAHESDGNAAPATPVPKAREARAGKRKAKKRVAGKPDWKNVRIDYMGKIGTPLNVSVDEVSVRGNAVAIKKVLLAACILHKKNPNAGFRKTEDLRRLALTEEEFEKVKDRPRELDNWRRSLKDAHDIHLEFKDRKHRFRLLNVKFNTSLTTAVIEAGLTQFTKEHSVETEQTKPSS